MAWLNGDGLLVRFGNDFRDKNVNVASAVSFPEVKQVAFDYDLSKTTAATVTYTADLNNDGTNDGFAGDVGLPAYANVLRVTLVVEEAAAGGTSITFGTFLADGTAVDADGLLTATEGVLANLNAVGKRINGNGAHVALTSNAGASIGSDKVYLALTPAGTFTAGKGKIVVEYI